MTVVTINGAGSIWCRPGRFPWHFATTHSWPQHLSVEKRPHSRVAEETSSCYNMPIIVREYDLIADWHASKRVDQTSAPAALALLTTLPPCARVPVIRR